MAGKGVNEGLSVAYRIGYRLRRIALSVFGPAQLGEGNDPLARLEAERDAKVARAREAREAEEARKHAA